MTKKIVYLLLLILSVICWIPASRHISVGNASLILQAEDIIGKHILPVWQGNNTSTGALPIYFLVPLVFVFGTSLTALYISGFISFAVLVFSTYLFAKNATGIKGGLVAAGMVAFLILFSGFEGTSEAIILILNNFLLLFIYKICCEEKKQILNYAALGFILGISFWSTMLFLPMFFLTIILLLLENNKYLISKNGVVLFLFYLLGSFPFWHFNILNNYTSFEGIENRTLVWSIPFYGILYAITLLYYYYKIKDDISVLIRNKLRGISGRTLIALMGFVVISFNASLSLVNPEDMNFSLFLCSTVPYIGAFILKRTDILKRRFALWGIAVLIIVFNVPIYYSSKLYKSVNHQRMIKLISEIKKNNAEVICSEKDLISVVRLLSKEKIKTVAIDGQLDNNIIFPVQKSAIVVSNARSGSIEKLFKTRGLKYQQLLFGDYTVFINVRHLEEPRSAISVRKWEAETNCANKDTGYAFDRDMYTRWTSDVRQRPGMYFLVDLNEERIVDKVMFLLGGDIYDGPAGLNIEVSKDGENWVEIFKVSDNGMSDLSSLSRCFGEGIFEKQYFVFEPTKIRYIKFTQTGYSFDKYWSIREIYLYGD